jgi:ubiquinone/menaquinone biosynthesis C-methylase UbiE
MEKYNLDKIWDEIALSYHKVSLISKAHIDKFEEVVNLIFKINPEKVLDLGCGTGILEKILLDKGFEGEIIAVDKSEKMLNIARNYIKDEENIEFKLLDIENNLPFPKTYFDCVVAINVFYLIKNYKKFLSGVKRILKTKGYFILVNPKSGGSISEFLKEHFKNVRSIKEIFYGSLQIFHILKIIAIQKKLDRLERKGIIHYHTKEELQNLLELAGFRVELIKSIQANQNWLFLLTH